MRICRVIVAIVLLAASAAAAVADPPEGSERIRLGEFIPATPPQPAPDMSFTDLTGTPATLADFKGQFLLVNLWATWCQPCLHEMPALKALQASLGPSLTVLAISEDRGGAAVVEPFIAKLGLGKMKVYLDTKAPIGHAVGARGLPTTIVVNGEGLVLGKVEGGADWDSPAMVAQLKTLIAGDAKDPVSPAAR